MSLFHEDTLHAKSSMCDPCPNGSNKCSFAVFGFSHRLEVDITDPIDARANKGQRDACTVVDLEISWSSFQIVPGEMQLVPAARHKGCRVVDSPTARDFQTVHGEVMCHGIGGVVLNPMAAKRSSARLLG